MTKPYVTPQPLHLAAPLSPASFARADLKLHEVDHSGPTFEGRVFLNNPRADETTPKTPENGYAGSFHIFGHGGCFGDEGHCEVPTERRPGDTRRPHPLTPAEKSVTITEALKRALGQGTDVQVTIVPVVMAATDKTDTEDVLHFKSLNIVTYSG